jgi:hypothetical protein
MIWATEGYDETMRSLDVRERISFPLDRPWVSPLIRGEESSSFLKKRTKKLLCSWRALLERTATAT